MAKTTKNKFVIIDPSQTSEFSHNYHYNRIIARQAREAGYDVTLMTHQKDVSSFSDLGVKVERAFPHSLYDYDGTHTPWRSEFLRRAVSARQALRNRFIALKSIGFFQTFPDALLAAQFIVRCLAVVLSPLIYLFDFIQSRVVFKQKPYHKDIFAHIAAQKFERLSLTKGDQVVMHSTTFGALEGFLSVRAMSRLKKPYDVVFTSIFHHSLEEQEASRSWYLEYYQRSEFGSLKRRWEIGSPFKTTRFLALTPQLVSQLKAATGLPFQHFYDIRDEAEFTKADALQVTLPTGEDCLVGLRTQDVTGQNVDDLMAALLALKEKMPNVKLCFLNRGATVSKREAIQLAVAFGGFETIDTSSPTAFLAAFKQIDVLILPYVASEYRSRVSAILYESSAFGIPVIVPAETTLANEVGRLKVHAFKDREELTSKLLDIAKGMKQDRILRQSNSNGLEVRNVLLRNVVKTDFNETANAIELTEYGPVAAIVSPFWGRCGSSTVFESETEYLLKRGYYIARFMVIQWRVTGSATKYVLDVLRENVARTRPHVFLLASPQRRRLISLRFSKNFYAKSALGQDVIRLGKSTEHDPSLSEYFFKEASVAVVNHSFHGDYLKRFKKAKIVLETQDIQALQYQIRNETNRMTGRAETYEQWFHDEIDVWKGVDACVNLSPDEQETIKQFQPNSHFVLPLIDERMVAKSERSWPQFCADNEIHESVGMIENFDFLLWGDFHPANIKSTAWFVENVVIPEVIPDMNTLIVGRVGHQMYNMFGSRNRLYLGGFVDSLDDAIVRSKLLILPDQAGSGISIKTMDALALQRPFVATTLALRSLNLGDGRFKGCETLEEFIADCKLLLKSEKARKERVKIAKYLYDLNFSRAQYYAKWDNVLSSVGITPHIDVVDNTTVIVPQVEPEVIIETVAQPVVTMTVVARKITMKKTIAAAPQGKNAKKSAAKKAAS
jgi:polysaccharide biosynthesis protein PslH